jgi:gliding motility-associated-like protein
MLWAMFLFYQTLFIQSLTPITFNKTVSNPNQDFMNGCITIIPSDPNANYAYQWNNTPMDTNVICSLDSGYYCVTITNLDNSCTVTDCSPLKRIWQPITIDAITGIVVQRPSCTDSDNGKITINVSGGNPPYSFDWVGPSISVEDSTAFVSNLKQGLYSVTVTDENGTTEVRQITVLSKSNITATSTNVPGPNGWDVSGAGICDGEVQIAATGAVNPITFQWNNGITTSINGTLCEGPWNVVVTDAEGCSVALNGTLTAPGSISIVSSCVDKNGYCITCHGDNDGIAKVSAAGGVAPYKVFWSTGFSQILNSSSEESVQPGLKGGDYGVTITDGNGIVTTKTVTVTEPASVQIAFTTEKPTRFTNCDAFVVANLVGGATGTPTYTWSSKTSSGTGNQVEGLCAGQVVNFLAQDANGCIGMASDTVDYPDDGCLLFRPVLTPSDMDEKNDFMLVTCVEFVPQNSIEIFNRWGQLVFQTEGYDNDSNSWKGTNSRGEALPEGVYFYVFKYLNPSTRENVTLKGYVNLLR